MIAVIADDLTGANDTGVQFSSPGQAAITILPHAPLPDVTPDQGVVVLVTESRSLPAEEAYQRVYRAALQVRRMDPAVVYKKIDSTMRGNIGAELDAIYDVIQPDFVVISPSYPAIGRTVVDGHLFVGGIPIDQTETARDPKTPVKNSYIPALLSQQTRREIETITAADLSSEHTLPEKIKSCLHRKIPYLVVDAAKDEDLAAIVTAVLSGGYRVVWAGAAGLANSLAAQVLPKFGQQPLQALTLPKAEKVLTVVGSVSPKSRAQLDLLLREPNVVGIEMRADKLLTEEKASDEIRSAFRQASDAFAQKKQVALFTGGSQEAVSNVLELGRSLGMDNHSVGEKVSALLGLAAADLIRNNQIQGAVLTGGDTAIQVCKHLGLDIFRIYGEIESGVPIGLFSGRGSQLTAVTKAGGFGKETVLRQAMAALEDGIL